MKKPRRLRQSRNLRRSASMSKREIIDGLKAQIGAIESNAQSIVYKSSSSPRTKSSCEELDPSDSDRALKRIVSWVNVSERSEHAVRERLELEGFTDEAINEAVGRAIGYGFIDDMRFAASLIRSRLRKGRGDAGIRRELAAHGIDLDDVPGWPYEFVESDDEQLERALAYLDRHPTRSKNKREGAYRKLVQNGYPAAIASNAARLWSESAE